MMPAELKLVIAGLPTKSAQIRELARREVPRAEIARMLNIRYQHVRNVLEHEKARSAQTSKSVPAVDAPASAGGSSMKIRLGPDGRIVVPALFRESLGLKENDVLFARLEDGEIHLLTPKAAMLRAQAIIRDLLPAGVSLVDDLLEDRRREVEADRG